MSDIEHKSEEEKVDIENSQTWIFNHLPLSDLQKAIVFKHIQGELNDNELAEALTALAERGSETEHCGEPGDCSGSGISKPTVELCE